MSETTSTETHAHEVLNLIGDNDGKLTETELGALAEKTFGSDARYYACFGDSLTLQELIPALFERQKLSLVDGKIQLLRQNMC